MTKKKILVTSALPYVNNVPHLGNVIPIISADVYSRYLKIKSENCIFVCGTDEHGTTAEIKAKEEGLTPRELVNKYFKIHKSIYDWFNFDFDCFGRTSSKENIDISQDIFKKLYRNGFIIEKKLIQMWDEKEKRFLSDRFIEGTCPFCGYESARGDQCDNCNKLLDPVDLINPKSVVSKTTPIEKESVHLFIDLKKIEKNSELEKDLSSWIQENKKKWTNNALTTTNAWIKEGLKPRCITRDLNWGVPVPYKELNLSEEYKNKVFYSWFDAPIGYISITAESKKDWKDWWKNPEQTQLVQFMGKDNIPFHTILFPSFCIGAKDNYTLMNEISVNEFINYQGGKFSKSRKVGVFGDGAIQSGISSELYRFYLMAIRPEKEDTDFDWFDFQIKVNKELIGNLGNLINRVLTFISKFSEGFVEDSKEYNGIVSDFSEFDDLVEKIKIKELLQKIFKVSNQGNLFFQKNEPWVKIKKQPEECKKDLAILARLVKDISILIYPYMPVTSKEILNQLNLTEDWIKWDNLGKELPENHKINVEKIKPLFEKLEDDKILELIDKFKGISENEIFPLDIVVGKIIDVEDHPDAEKLLVLKLDIGKEERKVVAGLKKYYSKEDLKNKKVAFLSNLEYSKIRGVESQGMVLAGVNKEQNSEKVEIISLKHSEVGEKIYFDKSTKSITEKIKYSEFSKLYLVVSSGNVFLGDVNKKLKLKTNKEVIKLSLNSGKIY